MKFNCSICADYLEHRGEVLVPAFAHRAFIRGVHASVVATEFMYGVHRRHLAGKSLAADGTI